MQQDIERDTSSRDQTGPKHATTAAVTSATTTLAAGATTTSASPA